MAAKKEKATFEKKDPVPKEYVLLNIDAYSFLAIIGSGLTAYFILCLFVYANISEDAVTVLVLVAISIIALFATYITFKLLKLIYYVGYNIFLSIDEKFSVIRKFKYIYHKIKSLETKKDDDAIIFKKSFDELFYPLSETLLKDNIPKSDYELSETQFPAGNWESSTQDESKESLHLQITEDGINILQKEIDELKQKLAESQDIISDLTWKLRSENEVSSQNDIDIAITDEDYVEKAIEVAVNNGQLSTSMLQRKLKLGYARATRIMDELEELGVIGSSEGASPHKVLMSKMQYDQRQLERNKSRSDSVYDSKIPSEQNESHLKLTYDEIKSLPEYKVIKEYVSKLKMIDINRFVNELSPFDHDRTCQILATLLTDKVLIKYTDGYLLYAENNAILSSVDRMSENGIEFEHFTVELLSKNGFTKVKRTQSSGDYGIDVLAEKDSVTYAIQCKCYSKPVGNKAVQEAYSGKDFYRCMVAVVFTNNYFTKAAIETAKQNNVILWDRNKLIEFIQSL